MYNEWDQLNGEARRICIRAPKSAFGTVVLCVMVLAFWFYCFVSFALDHGVPIVIRILFSCLIGLMIAASGKRILDMYCALHETLVLDSWGVHYFRFSKTVELPWEQVHNFGKYNPFWTFRPAVYISSVKPFHMPGVPEAAKTAEIRFSPLAYKGLREKIPVDADDCIDYCRQMTKM